MSHLQPDTSYPIFNHANGFKNLFRQPDIQVSPNGETCK